MSLIDFWLGTQFAKGNGQNAVLILVVLFVIFMPLIFLLSLNPLFGVVYLFLLTLVFITVLLSKQMKRKKR